MNAIELLESKHREVEKLFGQIDKTRTICARRRLLELLADRLTVYSAIEEHQLYPAVRAKQTGEIPSESLGEHAAIKRVLADLLETVARDQTVDAKIKTLKERVEHHVQEEERELFPKVKTILTADELEELERSMRTEQTEIEEKGQLDIAVPKERDARA
jgi:hemerythrin superfamily protein